MTWLTRLRDWWRARRLRARIAMLRGPADTAEARWDARDEASELEKEIRR